MEPKALTQQLSTTIADMVDRLEKKIEALALEVDDMSIDVCGIALEVKGTKDGKPGTGIMTQCTDKRAFVQAGLFLAASQNPLQLIEEDQ